ncbi:hypothetical protein BDAP_002754 [Binucleata daphniae]
MNVILEFKGKIDVNKLSDFVFDDKTNTLYFKLNNKNMEAEVKETMGRYIAVINDEQYMCDNTAVAKRCYKQI